MNETEKTADSDNRTGFVVYSLGATGSRRFLSLWSNRKQAEEECLRIRDLLTAAAILVDFAYPALYIVEFSGGRFVRQDQVE